jgi:RNA polymerase sigma factor (sigma-70 family)
LAHDDILTKTFMLHRAALVAAAAPIVGSRSHAEDVVQDAYVKLSEPVAADEIRQPVSYLFRLVRNLAIDRARRVAIEIRYGAKEPVPFSVAADEPTPEEALAARDMLRALEQALTELPDRTRTVFEMSRVGGHSVPHIARALGISERLVYLLLRDAMSHCRERLFSTP